MSHSFSYIIRWIDQADKLHVDWHHNSIEAAQKISTVRRSGAALQSVTEVKLTGTAPSGTVSTRLVDADSLPTRGTLVDVSA